MYLDNVIDNMLKGLNQQFKVMLCNICDLGITICILYFLLPIIGMMGFVIALYVSEIFNFFISYLELYKTTGFKIKIFDLILKPVIICFGIFYLLRLCF